MLEIQFYYKSDYSWQLYPLLEETKFGIHLIENANKATAQRLVHR